MVYAGMLIVFLILCAVGGHCVSKVYESIKLEKLKKKYRINEIDV